MVILFIKNEAGKNSCAVRDREMDPTLTEQGSTRKEQQEEKRAGEFHDVSSSLIGMPKPPVGRV